MTAPHKIRLHHATMLPMPHFFSLPIEKQNGQVGSNVFTLRRQIFPYQYLLFSVVCESLFCRKKLVATHHDRTRNLAIARRAMEREKLASSYTIPSKKSRRYHPGTVALREIKKQQKATCLLVPRKPFQRTVREFFEDYKSGLRFSGNGLEKILQEVAESLIVQLASDCQLCSIHAGRVTVQKKDMELARSILQKRNYRA